MVKACFISMVSSAIVKLDYKYLIKVYSKLLSKMIYCYIETHTDHGMGHTVDSMNTFQNQYCVSLLVI